MNARMIGYEWLTQAKQTTIQNCLHIMNNLKQRRHIHKKWQFRQGAHQTSGAEFRGSNHTMILMCCRVHCTADNLRVERETYPWGKKRSKIRKTFEIILINNFVYLRTRVAFLALSPSMKDSSSQNTMVDIFCFLQ